MCTLRNLQFMFVVIILGAVALASANTKILASANTKTLVNTHAGKDPKCLLPKEPGPCRMRLERFYYNANTDSCEEFVFGGCKGNDNSFGFKETCEETCKSVPLTRKQLNPSTLKSLTATSPVTEKIVVTTVTTPKPQVAVKQ